MNSYSRKKVEKLEILCAVLGIALGILMICYWNLKKGVVDLRKKFVEVKENHQSQQCVTLAYPNQELEKLAYEINEYVGAYFMQQAEFRQNVRDIRSEITNLSHDLRTPLTSILGYLDLIESQNLTSDQIKALEVIKRRSLQLNSLVEQLYEYARLENNEYRMCLEPIDIYRILKEHILDSYSEFEEAGIYMIPHLPEQNQGIYIQADRNGLERILNNLTSNTLKYCNGSAGISLEIENDFAVLIYQTARGELSDYDVLHLFDRFYRKDQARAASQSSGLGLTVTKLLVEQMNGKIYARAEDESLEIILRFPLVE